MSAELAELAGMADLQRQAMVLVEVFRDARTEERDCLIEQGDIADLMLGLVLVVSSVTCMLAKAWGMSPELLHATLRQLYAEQAAA